MITSQGYIPKKILKEEDGPAEKFCCQTGCPNCPYFLENEHNPQIPCELQMVNERERLKEQDYRNYEDDLP